MSIGMSLLEGLQVAWLAYRESALLPPNWAPPRSPPCSVLKITVLRAWPSSSGSHLRSPPGTPTTPRGVHGSKWTTRVPCEKKKTCPLTWRDRSEASHTASGATLPGFCGSNPSYWSGSRILDVGAAGDPDEPGGPGRRDGVGPDPVA